MKITRYTLSADHVPVDFFADPDGAWEFNDLVEAAGFDPESPGICLGALIEPFHGHPEGSAVVTEMGRPRPFVAIVECGAMQAPERLQDRSYASSSHASSGHAAHPGRAA